MTEQQSSVSLFQGHDRLLLKAPNKSLLSVILKARELTIGRGSDQNVIIDDPKLSERHVLLRFDGKNYTVTDQDSRNGTFLAETELEPGVPQVWPPGVVLYLGDSWLSLERAEREDRDLKHWLEQASNPDSLLDLGNESIPSSGPLEPIALTLLTTDLSVIPGNVIPISFKIINQEAEVDHFGLSLTGLPADWLPILPSIPLMDGEARDISLTIQPPRSAQSRAGSYSFLIRATSRNKPDLKAEVSGVLTITAYYHFECELYPQKQSGAGAGYFTVKLNNLGNTDLIVGLEAKDREEGCYYTFEVLKVQVPPGQESAVRLTVKPKTSLYGIGSKIYPFTITIQPLETDEPAQYLQGEWEYTPPDFSLSLDSSPQKGQTEGNFGVKIINQSQAKLTIQFETVEHEKRGSQYIFDQTKVQILPRQQRIIFLKVQARALKPGQATITHSFKIVAWPTEASDLIREVRGVWEQYSPEPEPTPVSVVYPPSSQPAKKESGCWRRLGWAIVWIIVGYLILAIIFNAIR